MRFTSAYSAASVCSPTRAAIMTGKSPARLKLTTFLPGRPDAVSQLLLHPDDQPAIAGECRYRSPNCCARRLSYRAASANGISAAKASLPTDRGFDLYHPGKALTEPSATEGGKGEYDLTEQAEKFIDDNKDQALLPLSRATTIRTSSLNAKQELIDKHKDAFNPTYAAMIETLDDCVGRVVAKLDALGLAENTIIIFTSDNGGLHVLETPRTPATYNRPFRARQGLSLRGGRAHPADRPLDRQDQGRPRRSTRRSSAPTGRRRFLSLAGVERRRRSSTASSLPS